MFIRLIGAYCSLYGPELLETEVAGRDGQTRTLKTCAQLATTWMSQKITDSPWHLYEFKRLNPLGLFFQGWKDSNTSHLHLDGSVANGDGGVASIDLQGYAYDALLAAATWVASDESEAKRWQQQAKELQNETLERLWMPDQRYFAMGLDRDTHGKTRQIATLTSNPASLLETNLLLDLPTEKAQSYVEAIVRMIMSPEFLTAAGIRSRALQHNHLMDFADYHGSRVTWPKDTYDIAKGLARHGYYNLARHLENQLIRSVYIAGEFYEFFYVDAEGNVKYHYRHEAPNEPHFHDFGAANTPEPGQAWTLSTILAIMFRRRGQPVPASHDALHLETRILETIS